MSLDDTAALMAEPETTDCKATLTRRGDDLDQQINRLRRAKGVLAHFLDCTNENPATCHVIDDILNHRIDQALNRAHS